MRGWDGVRRLPLQPAPPVGADLLALAQHDMHSYWDIREAGRCLPKCPPRNGGDTPHGVGFLVRKGYFYPLGNIPSADQHEQWPECVCAQYRLDAAIVVRHASVVDYLEPTWPCVVLRHKAGGPINGDRIP